MTWVLAQAGCAGATVPVTLCHEYTAVLGTWVRMVGMVGDVGTTLDTTLGLPEPPLTCKCLG